ncbi:hypothetical protein DNTS_032452 [Danionella cerebrum]|uniref:Myosin tail domain-containing protein n=1 Tax=Danionella cerebrum TaxID=2873325 RepID=A0A553Q3B3_9TELE|nr:hypothetical protein DNTS_032452 [Danionella translucida]
MQLEQEYEEKQMVIHEKHDLEGLIATLCEQVGHRDFEVEKRLRRDLKRTHALLSDAQLLLSTVEPAGHRVEPGAFSEQLERLRSQLYHLCVFEMEDSEARCLEADTVQKTLSAELENAQTELENICRQKSLADEQLAQLHFERSDLMKRLEEDQEDLNELMKKHKALIAQSSSDISQIRELQAELEELKKQRQTLQEQTSAARVQFLESSTVARSIVSKQEARICDLENKLEFQRGQVKRFEVLVLRLRDSVVRLGEELEQSTEGEARERENCKYYRERLEETRIELEEQSERERESSRRRLELEQQVEELSAVRQTLQADLETSIRRIVDLQAALEDESSDEESDDDAESAQTAVESFSRRKDLDSMSSVGSSLGAEDIGEGIRRSCTQDLDEDVKEERSSTLVRSSSSSALSELLDGLRRKRSTLGRLHEAGESSVISLPTLQNPGASTLRRQPSALSMDTREEDLSPVGILKAYSIPNLPRSVSLRSNDTNSGKMNQLGSYDSTADASAGKMNRFSSYDSVTNPSSVNDTNSVQTNRFSSYDTSTDASSGKGNRFSSNVSLASSASSRQIFSAVSIPEEPEEDTHPHNMPVLGAHQPMRRRFLGGLVPEYSEMSLGVESLVFQNRRLPVNQDSEKREEAEITPAIRRAQSTSSLASTGSRTGQRRALSVHFGELPPSRASRRESESDSTSSGGSQECSVAQGERLEAEGSMILKNVGGSEARMH